jgi:hypothetical protein
LARHEQQGAVIVELAARLTPELRHGVAKRRQHFRRDVEAESVTLGFRARRITRSIARLPSRHELLDIAHDTAARRRNPRLFRGQRGYPRQLAHRRPAQLAIAKGTVELRKPFERKRPILHATGLAERAFALGSVHRNRHRVAFFCAGCADSRRNSPTWRRSYS